MPVFTEAQLRDADLIVLLTVTYAGGIWRFSSKPVEVSAANNQTYRYIGGLAQIELDDDLDLLATSPSIRSIPIAVFWPEDVANLIAQGHDLASAVGEVALLVEGDDLEDRVVVLTGYLQDPTYGEVGEEVAFSVTENSWDDVNQILDDEAVVLGGVTWNDPAEGIEGAAYPLVFGAPGPFVRADGTAKNSSGSPGLFLNDSPDYLLIAGHETPTGLAGDTVLVYNIDVPDTATIAAEVTTDNLGRRVTVVDVSTQTASAGWDDTHEYWISWSSGDAVGAGDLLEQFLLKSSLRLDFGRIATAKSYLNRVRCSGYVDEQGSPMEWIQSQLAPLLPVSMTSGPDGLYPAIWRLDSTAADAVAHLVEGAQDGIVRVGPVEYEGRDDVVNEISLAYALRARKGTHLRTRTISGDPTRLGETDVFLTQHARNSVLRYGRRASTIETSIIYEDASADLILTWQLLLHGFARRVVTLECEQRWGWLRKGDVVTVTMSRLSISEAVGLVRGIRWRLDGTIQLQIVLVEDPVRDLH